MRQKICQQIIKEDGKVYILIDESSTLSTRTTLIVHLRCQTKNSEEAYFHFLDLLELPSATAETITKTLLSCMSTCGFSDSCLQRSLVRFTSDRAEVMLGKMSGVGQTLLEKYPRIILWHCLNHRLEFSVGDTISEVHGANHGWWNLFQSGGGHKCTLKRNYSKFCGLNWQM